MRVDAPLAVFFAALTVVVVSATGFAHAQRGASTRVGSTSTARPFEHPRHELLRCSECHGTGAQHRTLLVRTPRDCAACHHDARRGFACRNCHAPQTLPEQRTVTVALNLAVLRAAPPRELSFGHARHASLDCHDCHGTPVTLRVDRECGSCHARHEQPNLRCASCHSSELKARHRADAHFGCAAGGCHAARAGIDPQLRSTCLACHPAQTEHEPAGSCAACHKVPAPGAVPGRNREQP